MELIGRLKKKVDQAASREEARELIEQAGMMLTDEELGKVSGGSGFLPPDQSDYTLHCWQCGMEFSEDDMVCKYCGWPRSPKKG